MLYRVTNIDKNLFAEPKCIVANSPLEAVKKAYPQYEVSRDYNNMGSIVVSGRIDTRNGKGCRTYVYNIKKKG